MSTASEPSGKFQGVGCVCGCRKAEIVGLLARWILGALFVVMGLNKAVDPVGFLKVIREYQMGTPILSAAAALIPWFEVFAGVLLLAGVAVRGTSFILFCMLIPFTVLILKRALALSSLQGIGLCAIRFDCGCGAGEVWVCGKLVENLVLIVLCAWLVASARSRFCLRFSLLRD